MVENYITVLKKCFVPLGYVWNEVHGEELGIRAKNGIKVANGSVGVVAYNKKAQMLEQNGYFSMEDINEADRLLRFEVQLYSSRIRYLCGKDNTLKNLLHFFQCCESISGNILKNTFLKYSCVAITIFLKMRKIL